MAEDQSNETNVDEGLSDHELAEIAAGKALPDGWAEIEAAQAVEKARRAKYETQPRPDEESFPFHRVSDHNPPQQAMDMNRPPANFVNAMKSLGEALAPMREAGRADRERRNAEHEEARRRKARRIDDLMEHPETGMTTQELLALSERYAVLAMRSLNEDVADQQGYEDFGKGTQMSQALATLAAARIALYGSSYINGAGGMR